MHRIKWLLVEWENTNQHMDLPQYGVVHIRSLLDQSTELHTGKLVYVSDGSGIRQRAKVVMSSGKQTTYSTILNTFCFILFAHINMKVM